MTFLPIVERELRVAARRPWVHWLRVAAGALVMATWLLLWLAAQGSWSPQKIGAALFNGISLPAFIFACFTGVFLTADSVSAERQEGTLGLLFLTDLRGHDIALGKLAAKSLEAASVLLALVPLLAVPLLLGGVSGESVGRRALTLLLAAGLSLATGLLCSTLLGETRKALLATLTVLTALLGLPLLAGFIADLEPLGLRGSQCFQFSPVYTFAIAEGNWGPTNTLVGRFNVGCAWQAVLILGFLALASWRLPGLARSEPVVTSPKVRESRCRRGSAGIHAFWLAGRESGLGGMLFGVLLVLWAAWLGLSLLALIEKNDDAFGLSLIPAFGLHLVLKCQFAAEAARRFATDRASGAMEMLLTTPLPPRRILVDSWRGLKRRFRPARILALSVNGGVLLFFLLGSGFGAPWEDWVIIVPAMLAALGLLLLDCWALAWAGMLEGVRGRTPLRAALGAVIRVMVPGWAMIFVYLFLGFSGLIQSDDVAKLLLVAWFLACAAIGVWVAGRARGVLFAHLRLLAAGESLPKPSNDGPAMPAPTSPVSS
jgi:ABC-type transport system involved in multi-copper enzyme maturation permease subunit